MFLPVVRQGRQLSSPFLGKLHRFPNPEQHVLFNMQPFRGRDAAKNAEGNFLLMSVVGLHLGAGGVWLGSAQFEHFVVSSF